MQKKSKKLFINLKSFLNNRGSIFEIQISSSDYEKYFLIKPKIEITYIFEKHYDIKKEELLKKPNFKQLWSKILKKFPSKYFDYISYNVDEISLDLKIFDYRKMEKVVFPMQDKKRFKHVKNLRKYYYKVKDKYDIWKKDNEELKIKSDFSLSNKNFIQKENIDKIDIKIKKIFKKNGKLSNYKNFSYREEQEKLALKINDVINEKKNLMANAPTGIGKSLAYLFNAYKYSISENKKILISTFTKKLQDQLKNKDIPFVNEFLHAEFDIVFLKGRKNYLCLREFYELLDTNIDQYLKDYIYNMFEYKKIYDLDYYDIDWKIKDKLSSEQCLHEKCEYFDKCYFWKLREKAKKSRVLVINHALLINGLNFNMFKKRDILFVDEAHHLERIMVDELGGELSEDQFNYLYKNKRIRSKDIIRKWHDKFHKLLSYNWEDMKNIIKRLKKIKELSNEFFQDRIDGDLNILKKFYKYSDNYYIDKIMRNGEMIYKLYPYRVDKWIQKNLWENFFSNIFLSGTLFLNSSVLKDIFIKIYNINKKKTEFIDLKTTFNYKENVKYLVPTDFPEYDYQNKSEYFNSVIVFLKEYIKRTEGKLMVLFTSYEDLNFVKESISDFLKKNGIKLYVNSYDLDKIKNDIFYVIFGTYSMWEGVDIDNNYLNSLIMVKSPFSVPSNGYFVSKKKILSKSMYYFYYLNSAVVKFRQGFGRLIRSKKDRGVFIFLDNRIKKRSYKKYFSESIADNINFNFVPTRDIFNIAEAFLFDKSGLFLKNYKKRKNKFKFLDHNQVYIARDGQKGIKVIYGAAGTGKTVILIHRMKFLMMHFPDIKKVLFLTYTASLSRYIENILNLENINIKNKNIQIDYLYRFCRKNFRSKKDKESFKDYYKKILKNLKNKSKKISKYDVIFIDEGQDLGFVEYQIIFSFLKKKNSDLIIAIDNVQDLYRMNFNKFFEKREVQTYKLKNSYRNTANIMKFANIIVRNLFIHDSDEFFNEGDKPYLVKLDNFSKVLERTKDFINKVIDDYNYTLNDFAIVYPRKNIYGFKNVSEKIISYFNENNMNIKNISTYQNKKSYLILDNNIKLSTIHSIKGLEFKAVIILGFDDIFVNERNKKLLYVAITRAKYHLFIPYLKKSGFVDYIGAK